MKLNNFDIVLIEFVYKEQLNKPIEERDFKYRPALILNKNLILEVVQISSKVRKYKNNKNCYIIKDLKAAGLDKPSLIRFNIKLKLADIDQKTIKKIGHLAEEDIKAIKKAGFIESFQEIKEAQIMTKLTDREKEANKMITEKLDYTKGIFPVCDKEDDDNEFWEQEYLRTHIN